MRPAPLALVAIGLLSALVTSACSGACDYSSLDVTSANVTFSSFAVTDPKGTIDIAAGGGGLSFWLGLTGAGDGKHYELDFYNPPVAVADAGTSSATPPPDAVRLACSSIAPASLAASSTMGLASFCGCNSAEAYCVELDVLRDGAWEQLDLSKVDGTVHVDAGGDPAAAGTTRVTIDVPGTTVPTMDGKATASVAITALAGTQARAMVSHHGTCSGGGNGLGTYGGWMPGGG